MIAPADAGTSRRRVLGIAVAAVAAIPATGLLGCSSTPSPLVPGSAPSADVGARAPDGFAGLKVRPRADWANGSDPPPAMAREAAGDVRFLLVHHSVSANDYGADEVPGLIRGFQAAHTAKGWPDVAYNFFVDRFGGIWEGRAGSQDGPMIADATGGNQGYSQLCCLIGDFRTEEPAEPALDSLCALLAALADRYGVDTAPDSRAQFVSRGSNRWPSGTTVTTPTIAGHRDMSRTECPGAACYALIRGPITDRVNKIRAR